MEPPSTVSVSIRNESGRAAPAARLRTTLKRALASHGISSGEVTLLLADDEAIQALNRTFRGLDETTDVLTFPAGEWPGNDQRRPIGDIAISTPVAERQAQLRGVSTTDELCLLALHGALHLVGFDDVEEADRQAMQIETQRIARALGLPAEEAWTSLAHGVAS